MKKYKKCLVIGKFMPPHKGHEYMIRFAKEYAEKVFVVVDCLKEQTSPPEKRKKWLEEEITGIDVKALTNYMPQDPSETPEFWNIWKNELLKALDNEKPDLVVAGMDYGQKLSEVMECDFIPIDIARETFPVSATMIRENAFDNWEFLMNSAKPDFIKKVCLLGPESTGKSTAVNTLAQSLKTIYVPEYAKAIIERQKGEFFKENVEPIASAQISSENALARFTNKIMVCDSSALTTLIYSEKIFNYRPPVLENIINNHKYDLYCLFSPDTEFVDDIHRRVLSNPQKERIEIYNIFKKELKHFNIQYEVISGTYEQRDKKLLSLVNNKLLNLNNHKRIKP